MLLSELKALFAVSFQENEVYKYSQRQPAGPGAASVETQHCFFPIQQYGALANMLAALPDDDDIEKLSVRYLVASDMRINCHAAGNLFFSPDYAAFTKITHQSGDFRLTAASLVWPIAVLIHMNAPMTTPFMIEINTTDAHGAFHVETTFELNREQLIDLLPLTMAEIAERMQAANAGVEIEDNNYRERENTLIWARMANAHAQQGFFSASRASTPPPTRSRAEIEASYAP